MNEHRVPTGLGRSPLPPIAWRWLLVIAGARLLLHLVTNGLGGYGIFRDEFYYLACAARPALGYVDQPPLSLWLLAAQTALFGDSLFALRLLPSFLGAGIVLLTGLLARELRGGAYAQALAALFAFFVPSFLGITSFYSMNGLDHVIWIAALLLVARIVNSRKGELWRLVGLVLGLGLLNKLGVVWLGAGIFLGLLLTRERRQFTVPCPWVGAIIAGLLFLPHLIWQISHDWPTLEFVRNAVAYNNVHLSPLAYLGEISMSMHPLLAPFWVGGLVYLVAARGRHGQLWMFWTFLIVLAYLMFSPGSKPYYAAPLFYIPFAAGAVGLAWLTEKRRTALWRSVAAAYVLVMGLLTLPISVPLLNPSQYMAYAEALGLESKSAERHEASALPQHYADRFGWRALAQEVAEVYHDLTPEEKKHCAIFGTNYGRAASLEYYAEEYDLPPVVSGHNNYWLWGPRGASGQVMIVVGEREERLRELFEHVELAAVKRCTWCMPYEDEVPIWICRGLRIGAEELWAETKQYI